MSGIASRPSFDSQRPNIRRRTHTSLKALILVGGFGTRLRPLTLSVPKPLVEFANKPMIVHQIEALKAVGVDEVVLAINYRPETMRQFIEEYQEKIGIKITVSLEESPMGTAGPLALARDILRGESGTEPFFVLNSDVTCEFPLEDLLAFHDGRRAEVSIMGAKVEDPSKYGVVVIGDENRVERFVEKPKKFCGDKINAGIYVCSPSVLDRIELRPTSIEREIFPAVAADGALHAMVLPGFWMDLGQPKDFLLGTKLYLQSVRDHNHDELASGQCRILGNVIIHPTAKVSPGAVIGPDVSIGENCIVDAGARLQNCCVMRGCHIKEHAFLRDSIIGWDSVIGSWTRMENNCVLGEDVKLGDECLFNGVVVLPNKELKESIFEPRIVL